MDDAASGWVVDDEGWVPAARRIVSPNYDARPENESVSLLVVHAISLPPGRFGGDGVERLFTNTLDPAAHPFYAGIFEMKVSAHFFIRRDGELIQFVSCAQRAWHAGVSNWQGRPRCNDYSIGVELEGCDEACFEDAQYECLNRLAAVLCRTYPLLAVAGHADIAPGRKTDPGPFFEWQRLSGALATNCNSMATKSAEA